MKDDWDDLPRIYPDVNSSQKIGIYHGLYGLADKREMDIFQRTADEEVISAEQNEIYAGSRENPVIFKKQKIESLRNGSVPIVRDRESKPFDCFGRTYNSPFDVAFCIGCLENMTKAEISEKCPKCKKYVCAACSGTAHRKCVVDNSYWGGFVIAMMFLAGAMGGC